MNSSDHTPENPLKNDRLIRALLRKPIDRTPVWLMRQAGRYLPEYRIIREKAGGFLQMCKNPNIACEITMQPIERFELDAAIIFSDILTIPDAMGLGLYFETGEGPKFQNPITSTDQIKKLSAPDPEESLMYVMDAIRQTRQQLKNKVPLIGFSGSPWTLATYMIENGGSKHFEKVKGLMYKDPQHMHQLLEVLTQSVIAYLNAQIAAGAQAIMIFDSWGGVLSPAMYEAFSLYYMRVIMNSLTRIKEGQQIPITLFTKNGNTYLTKMADSGCDAVGVDWTITLQQARALAGDKVALQGNLDPCVLFSDPQHIRKEVHKVLASYGVGPGHVFNLGHGVLPQTNPDYVSIMIDAVHTYQHEMVR